MVKLRAMGTYKDLKRMRKIITRSKKWEVKSASEITHNKPWIL